MNAPKILWYDDQECAAGPVKFNSDEIKYVRADIAEEMRAKLEIAAKVFRAYQAHHEAKGHPDKAERNKGYAEQMDAALELLEDNEPARL